MNVTKSLKNALVFTITFKNYLFVVAGCPNCFMATGEFRLRHSSVRNKHYNSIKSCNFWYDNESVKNTSNFSSIEESSSTLNNFNI